MSTEPLPLPELLPIAPAGRRSSADADERRLLGLVMQGDMAAFETLYRIYHPRLSRFLQRMLRPPHLVEEVLNDCLLVVWHRAERYNFTSRVSTWIFAIAYRKALKALSRHDDPVAWDDENAQGQVADEARPEDRLGRTQQRAAIERALERLSSDQRAAVELTYFHGFSYPEIAAIVDCPVDTVKTRMFHARRRLKLALGGGLEDWL